MAPPKKKKKKAAAATLPTPKVPTSTTTKKASKWGLGEWMEEEVDTRGFFYFENDRDPRRKFGILGHAGQGPAPLYLHQLEHVMDQFGMLEGGELAAVQQALYFGGFYSKNYRPTLGNMHQEDVAAFREALKIAASHKVNLGKFLSQAAELGQESGDKRAPVNYKTAIHELKLTDPGRIGETLTGAFMDALGREPTEDEKARFAASFRAREKASQEKGFAADDAETLAYYEREAAEQGSMGRPVGRIIDTSEPDLAADVQSEVKNKYKLEYQTHKLGEAGATFFSMLKGE